MHASWSKLSENLRNDIDINVFSFWVIDQNSILHILINNSRTAWPTEISMPYLSFSDK